MLFPLVLLFFVRKWFYSSQRVLYWVLVLLVIPLISAFGWMVFHNLVYGADEVAGVFTFLFGFVGTFLSTSSMSFIPWSVLHFLTNFVISAKKQGLFASDFFLLELFLIELVS